MIVGCPKEIKNNENRVGLTPGGVWALTQAGHTVLVEKGAGSGSHFSDEEYRDKGAQIVSTASEVWNRSELVVKVKEPLPSRVPVLPRRPGAVHVSASGAGARSDQGSARQRHHGRGLRDGAAAQRRTAAAGAHERGGRPHGRHRRGLLHGVSERRRRAAHRRRAGRGPGGGAHHRRRHRGDQRGQDGGGAGRPGHHPGRQRRPHEVPGRRPAQELRDRPQRPLRHRAAPALLRPGRRRGAGGRAPWLPSWSPGTCCG